jgi:hypothetical protein
MELSHNLSGLGIQSRRRSAAILAARVKFGMSFRVTSPVKQEDAKDLTIVALQAKIQHKVEIVAELMVTV